MTTRQDLNRFPSFAAKSPNARFRPRRFLRLALPMLLVSLGASAVRADDDAEIEKRLADTVRYLASDELEGRAVGTEGGNLAAEYVAKQFNEIGLKTALFDGAPMQQFAVVNSATVGPDSALTLIGPPEADGGEPVTLTLGGNEDFTPMTLGGSGEFDLPLVFVGYGITAETEGYDDYDGVDVEGTAVIILRHEPRQNDPESVFDGTASSEYAPFVRKLANAVDHGAAAVIFCTDAVDIRRRLEPRRRQWQMAQNQLADALAEFREIENPTLEQIEAQQKRIDELSANVQAAGERLRAESDPALSARAAGYGSQGAVPVFHCRRACLDQVLEATLDTNLAELELQIDEDLKPRSHPLEGWRIKGRADVQRNEIAAKNVIGVLEGEGPLAEETIIVGAHYDHLGRGRGGRRGGGQGQVYNGADDNASGVAAVIEIARTLAARPEKLRRRVVFIAFDGEERGLFGSAHYVAHPLYLLEKTVCMVDLDMVGRLRNEELIALRSETGSTFDPLLNEIDERDDDIKVLREVLTSGTSDHASFIARKIPALDLYTGMHDQLHQPTDDFETLNIPGMRQVTRFVTEFIVNLANADERPEFATSAERQRSNNP